MLNYRIRQWQIMELQAPNFHHIFGQQYGFELSKSFYLNVKMGIKGK